MSRKKAVKSASIREYRYLERCLLKFWIVALIRRGSYFLGMDILITDIK